MADLITHGCVALLAKAIPCRDPDTGSWQQRGHVATFVAGTFAPDLFGRAPGIVLNLLRKNGVPIPIELVFAWEPLHLPIGMVFLSFALCFLFPAVGRGAVFWNLLGGMGLHMLLDLLQDHMGVGYMVLYPVFDGQFEFGWIGSETTVFVAPVLALVTIWVWAPRWRASRLTKSEVSPG